MYLMFLFCYISCQYSSFELNQQKRERACGRANWQVGAGASHNWQCIICRVMDKGLGVDYILPSTEQVCVCMFGAVMV